MERLTGLFDYFAILLHGLAGAAQATALGSTFFLVFLARPHSWLLGAEGPRVATAAARIGTWAALALVAAEALGLAMQVAILAATLQTPVEDALRAQFALAGAARIGTALLLAAILSGLGARAAAWAVLPVAALITAASTFTTHAAARTEHGLELMAVSGLHQLGAALWIGGIPAFLAALSRTSGPGPWHVVGTRFSTLCIVGVACLLGAAAILSVPYIGAPSALYGTAYGVMVSAKILMTAALLLLGLGNFRLLRRIGRDPRHSINRVRRFAEVEFAIGVVIFLAAASLTSVPPAADLTEDRVTLAELLERNTPRMPRWESPARDALAIPALQARLDAEAAAAASRPAPAYVAGSGTIVPPNAADLAWSEYNHQWSGFFVLAIALCALLAQAGFRPARHWPLIFLGLAAFIFIRSDAEAWPLGSISFLDSLRDVEVLQHRLVVPLLVAFAIFEWRVRATGRRTGWQPLVFPFVCFAGGLLLLTHTHQLANVKQELLIEITHTPLALAGIAAGAARYLELRLDPPSNRIAGWIWPFCLLFVATLLIFYREA